MSPFTMNQTDASQACSVLTIQPTGLHEYSWARDMGTALEVMDPFQETHDLRNRYASQCLGCMVGTCLCSIVL